MKRVGIFLWRIIKKAGTVLIVLYLGAMLLYFSLSCWKTGPMIAVQMTKGLFITVPIKRFLIPVASDEDMIVFFNRHRKEFEEITRIHWEKCFIDPETHRERPEIVRLRERIGLRKVLEVGSIPGDVLWFDNPYSQETAERARKLLSPLDETSRRPHQCPHRAIEFIWDKYEWVQTSARWGDLTKGWLYFPVEPRVESGRIYFPNYLNTKKLISQPVLQSLDKLPKKSWREYRGECLYRKIDAQWFLFVCPVAL